MVQVNVPSFMCPHCSTKCSFSGIGVGDSAVLYCLGCGKGVYFHFPNNNFQASDTTVRVAAESVDDYYPRKVLSIDAAVPAEIGSDFEEANKCFSVGASRATVIMCRRVLQNACVKKGANPRVELLSAQIDELESKRIINPSIKAAAHSIGVIGAWGAHPLGDPLKDVRLEDAKEILAFTSEFLNEVFVLPAKLDALRQNKNQ